MGLWSRMIAFSLSICGGQRAHTLPLLNPLLIYLLNISCASWTIMKITLSVRGGRYLFLWLGSGLMLKQMCAWWVSSNIFILYKQARLVVKSVHLLAWLDYCQPNLINDDPEPQIIAVAIAAFYENNFQHEKAGLQPLQSMYIPAIIMIRTARNTSWQWWYEQFSGWSDRMTACCCAGGDHQRWDTLIDRNEPVWGFQDQYYILRMGLCQEQWWWPDWVIYQLFFMGPKAVNLNWIEVSLNVDICSCRNQMVFLWPQNKTTCSALPYSPACMFTSAPFSNNALLTIWWHHL